MSYRMWVDGLIINKRFLCGTAVIRYQMIPLTAKGCASPFTLRFGTGAGAEVGAGAIAGVGAGAGATFTMRGGSRGNLAL